jgi:puromycin-sensitive aminopeptidase
MEAARFRGTLPPRMTGRAHRLPRAVWPLHYAIDIATDPGRADFAGEVAIQLELRDPVDAIELHAKRLTLSEARLEVGDRALTPQVVLLPEDEAVRLTLPETVPAGPATLTLRFSGAPNPGMHGLYVAQDGADRAVATQCEATDARAIFPCFDEPEFKARLQWTVRTSPDVVALANGPLDSVETVDGEKVWRFAPTEPVSSYLAALTVGRFEGTPETKAGEVPVRVWAIRGKGRQAGFAHGFTEVLIPWYERYFDVPYPYGKYDQVAVPGFDAGAMENVGLVLFRQNLLLMDPGSASWNQEKLIAKVIAHELAHMWFGNLVTMKWWDDLWLNEAFAEWFAHKATHAAAPAYLVWNDFQSDKNRALVDDALPTTHPIYAPVATPGEALEMFDVITYQKGCAVMRMLEHFLGEAPFRTGLRTYMKAFAGKNATGADLWRHLEEASGQPVGALMRSWVEQAGFPMVSVRLEQGVLHLSQRRFFSSPHASAEDCAQTWNVPMVVRYEDDRGVQEHRLILDRAEATVTLPAQGPVRWCYANSDEIGFYRVRHEGEAAAALLARGADHLSAVEQMGLIEDHWALVRNGGLDVQAFLPVLERFAGSQDHNVMRAVSERLSTLDHLLEEAGEEEVRARLRAKVGALFGPHLEALGYAPREGESQNDRQRRALTIHTLANLGQVAAVISECEAWALEEQSDPRAVDPNLAGTFVGVAARYGDADRYATWARTYKARKEGGAAPQDSLRYLYSLAAFRPEALVAQTLGHLDDGLVPQEAVGSVLSQLLATLHGQQAAWDYLKARWEGLRGRVGDMGLPRVVEATGRLPGSLRADIVDFFRRNPPPGAERALARALENLDQREELKARLVPALKGAL